MWAADTLIALVLATCFVALGSTVLGRWPTSVQDWTQFFLVGLSIAALALFPLSLMLPGNALRVVEVGLLAVGGVCGQLRTSP